jgi:hypothetical protein
MSKISCNPGATWVSTTNKQQLWRFSPFACDRWLLCQTLANQSGAASSHTTIDYMVCSRGLAVTTSTVSGHLLHGGRIHSPVLCNSGHYLVSCSTHWSRDYGPIPPPHYNLSSITRVHDLGRITRYTIHGQSTSMSSFTVYANIYLLDTLLLSTSSPQKSSWRISLPIF